MNCVVQWRSQDFPEVGTRTLLDGGANIQFCQNFPKNCMKLKEFLLRSSATGVVSYTQNSKQRPHFTLPRNSQDSLGLKPLCHHQYSSLVTINSGFPLGLEKLEGIFKSENFEQTGKVREYQTKY